MSAAETNGPHDVGGRPAGPVERSEHELDHWEWRVDAMIRLCFRAGHLADFAELRRGIEELGDDVYERLSYYERWAASLAGVLVRKGVVGERELEERIAAARARLESASGEQAS